MKRRTLLQSALALPLATPVPAGALADVVPAITRSSRQTLTTGLAGLDYSIGGLAPGSISAFRGEPMTGKTLLLLELAARLVDRYRQNVLFFSVHQPSLYTARKVALRDDLPVKFANEALGSTRTSCSGPDGPAIYLLDASDQPAGSSEEMAERLQRSGPFGCTALLVDGWTASPIRSGIAGMEAGIGEHRARRWAHTPLSRDVLVALRTFGTDSGIPIVLGVTTPGETDHDAYADFVEAQMLLSFEFDRRVSLHRAELDAGAICGPAGDRNIVRLAGTSPQWWDTRYAKLRFDPGRLRFSTVV